MSMRLNIALLLLNLCGTALAIEPETAAPKPVMTVTLARPYAGKLYNTVEAHGKVVARENIIIATDLTGVSVTEVLAEAGDSVKKGQILARLDRASLQHRLDILQADLNYAEAEFQRVQTLQKTGAVSRQEAESKKAAFLMLRSQVADARLRLEKTEIISSADGLLYQRNIDVGSLIQADSTLFNIAMHNEIELEVVIPEAFAHTIKRGMKAEVSLGHMSAPLPASVRLVSPVVDQKTRTVSVRLTLAETPFIPVGAYCTASFQLPAGDGIIVPAAAIQQDTAGFYLWAVEDNGLIVRRKVQVFAGNTDSALVQGISENINVVARAGSFLQEGDYIRPAGEMS